VPDERQNGVDSVASVLNDAKGLLVSIRKIKVLQVSSAALKNRTKDLVKDYFLNLQPHLVTIAISTTELDVMMQAAMKMTNGRKTRSVYIKTLTDICRRLELIEASPEYIRRGSATVIAGTTTTRPEQDQLIVATLERLVPAAAASYKQVLDDLSRGRFSYRGTAGELREILREVLDNLAPDQDVMNAVGFQLETNRTLPTMRQKVHYILTSRSQSATAMEVPEQAAINVDEGIARLVRATYNRGSASAHTQQSKGEVLQIKMYLDSVLGELLEIHKG